MAFNAIQFSMGLDIAQLQSGAMRAQSVVARAVGRMRASSAATFGFLSAAGVAAFGMLANAGVQAAGKLRGAYDLGDQLGDLGKQTGVAAGRLYILQQAFKESGVSEEKLLAVLPRMSKLIGAGSDAFDQLGLSAAELAAMAPDQAFARIGDAIAAIPDQSKKAKAAIDIFGRSGAELLSVFESGALASAAQNFAKEAEMLDRNSQRFGDIADRMDRVGEKLRGFTLGIAEALAGSVEGALGYFEGIDFAAKGREVGAIIGGIAGAAMVVVGLIQFAEAAVVKIVAWLIDGFNHFWNGMKQLSALVDAAFYAIASGANELVASFLDLAVNIGAGIYTALQWAFGKAKEFFGNGMFDLIANIAAALQFALNKALVGILSVLPNKLKRWLGAEKVQPKTFEEFQAENKSALAGFKSGYKAPDFASAFAANKEASGIGKLADALHGSAERTATKAMERWGDYKDNAFGQYTPAFNTDSIHFMAGDLFKSAGKNFGIAAGSPAAAKPGAGQGPVAQKTADFFSGHFENIKQLGAMGFDRATGKDRAIKFDEHITGGGLIGKNIGGVSGPAYGLVRRGQARAEREWIAQQKKAKAEKDKGIEGTNVKLEKANETLEEIRDGLVGG